MKYGLPIIIGVFALSWAAIFVGQEHEAFHRAQAEQEQSLIKEGAVEADQKAEGNNSVKPDHVDALTACRPHIESTVQYPATIDYKYWNGQRTVKLNASQIVAMRQFKASNGFGVPVVMTGICIYNPTTQTVTDFGVYEGDLRRVEQTIIKNAANL